MDGTDGEAGKPPMGGFPKGKLEKVGGSCLNDMKARMERKQHHTIRIQLQ